MPTNVREGETLGQLAELKTDSEIAAVLPRHRGLYFAGPVTEIKRQTLPMGEGVVNLSVREPYGVCARAVAYNHPLMFAVGKFGPVLAVPKWRDEKTLFKQVNAVEYGLTCPIWTTNLANAHRAASRIEAGYVWVNNTSRHFIGAPFGGYKQSGIGREESIEELLDYTQVKNINVTLA